MDNYEERARRLREVFSHLFIYESVSNQKEMAKIINMPAHSLSAAMHGNKSFLTNNTFIKVCLAFPGVFDLNYLLTGEGELLMPSTTKMPHPQPVKEGDVEKYEDTQTFYNLAKELVKENEALQRDLKASIAELRSLINHYGTIVEQSSQKTIHQHSDMVVGDKDFE